MIFSLQFAKVYPVDRSKVPVKKNGDFELKYKFIGLHVTTHYGPGCNLTLDKHLFVYIIL